MLPSYKTIGGCSSLLNVNEYVNSSSLRTALTLNVNVCGAGVNVPVPSRTIFSPSSKSCSSSKTIPSCVKSEVPCSNWIPSWNGIIAEVCSCSILITFSKLVDRTWVELSQLLIVPVWLVKVLPAAKVPVTSLSTKCLVGNISGGLVVVYLNPPSTILKDWAAPMLVVVAISFVPVPDVVSETVTVGSFV